jgi:radical S-adenosyl methionine domain-containing protein 2
VQRENTSKMMLYSFSLDFDEIFIVLSLLLILYFSRKILNIKTVKKAPDRIVPKSVNYHFTRRCNYECGFCFHTAKTSFMLDLDIAKRGLKLLKDGGE